MKAIAVAGLLPTGPEKSQESLENRHIGCSKPGNMPYQKAIILSLAAGASLLPGTQAFAATDTNSVPEEIRLLREQNALLQDQVQKQGSALDTLTKKVQELEAVNKDRAVSEGENPAAASQNGLSFGNVHLGAEGGVAFFNTGPKGFAPDSNFQVDETRVFVDAPIWESVYFHSDLDLATRENTDLNAKLGELYLDFEDASQLWGKDGQLNIRAGRLQVPFGEEYINRYAMENPLISHSLSDIWGIDPGVELYGSLGKFGYVVAVQNGSGANGVQDFDGDKSVAARISFDPNAHWHFSLSGMRTGDLNASKDFVSNVWFGSGWFRSIGSPATTAFHAELAEADITARWKSGHVSAFGGYAHYNDNDIARDNERNMFYYAIEAQQHVTRKFYLASRFSQILADEGYPVVGFGNFGDYFFQSTKQLWRASFGIGYQFNNNLALKAEYAIEHGTEVGGGPRYDENFLGTEAAFKF